MGVTTDKKNKPFNPRGNDQSPLAYNRAKLYSGKALDFDGVNDKVTISDNAAVDFGTSDFSIAFIMESSAAGNARILDKRNTSSGYTLYINSSKKLILELNDTTGNTGFATSTIYADGKLKHVVISADRDGNASFYINGAFDEGVDISSKSGNLDSTSDLFIGADAPSGTSIFYDGQLSGLKMYSTALTAAQVADLYNNPEKVVPTGVDNTALKLWLPMQEGAGTTAYDGSGNGNHGAVSGASWLHGIGAPVSQTAVIDWNKGSNLAQYSEKFNTAPNVLDASTYSENQFVSPNGSTDAPKFTETTANDRHGFYQYVTISSGSITASIFTKQIDRRYIHLQSNVTGVGRSSYVDLQDGSVVSEGAGWTLSAEDYGNGWWRISATATGVSGNRYFIWGMSQNGTTNSYVGSTSSEFTFWGLQVEQASSVGPYVRTGATAQTSEVLLPQGITTGRDITGVNLFENVRKQGALNLDGNSWAEVHDNESLDFGAGSFTLEAWVKAKYINQGSVFNMVISLGDNITSSNNAGLMLLNNNVPYFIYSNPGASSGSAQTEGDWIHIVGTYDETNTTLYVNGSQADQDARTASDITNGFAKLIGRDGTDLNRFYNDQIAQPRIYNRALTAEEVQRNYNAGKNTYTN